MDIELNTKKDKIKLTTGKYTIVAKHNYIYIHHEDHDGGYQLKFEENGLVLDKSTKTGFLIEMYHCMNSEVLG